MRLSETFLTLRMGMTDHGFNFTNSQQADLLATTFEQVIEILKVKEGGSFLISIRM